MKLLVSLFVLSVSTPLFFGCSGKTKPTKEQLDSIAQIDRENKRVSDSLELINKHKSDSLRRIQDSIANVKEREERKSMVESTFKNTEINDIDDIHGFYNAITYVKNAIAAESNAKLKAEWTSSLRKFQKRMFPIARKAWVKGSREKLWRQDIEVQSSGTTVSFIGHQFALNANIGDSYSVLKDALRDLRFKRCNFKWTKSSYAEYTYYTIDSKNDSDI